MVVRVRCLDVVMIVAINLEKFAFFSSMKVNNISVLILIHILIEPKLSN